MDLYITEKETGKKIALSLLPDSVKTKSNTSTTSYEFINVGEVSMPNGQKLIQYSWKGTLPGVSLKNMPFVKKQHWKSPKELINTIDTWRKNGTKLVLLLTETSINSDVYLSSFSYEWKGGSGNVEYDIAFIQAKDVKIYTIVEAKSSNTSSNRPASKSNNTGSKAQTKTYTVKKGDCLWNIAKKYLGSGSKYMTIYNLNKKTIGSNPNLIYPGQVLILPC